MTNPQRKQRDELSSRASLTYRLKNRKPGSNSVNNAYRDFRLCTFMLLSFSISVVSIRSITSLSRAVAAIAFSTPEYYHGWQTLSRPAFPGLLRPVRYAVPSCRPLSRSLPHCTSPGGHHSVICSSLSLTRCYKEGVAFWTAHLIPPIFSCSARWADDNHLLGGLVNLSLVLSCLCPPYMLRLQCKKSRFIYAAIFVTAFELAFICPFPDLFHLSGLCYRNQDRIWRSPITLFFILPPCLRGRFHCKIISTDFGKVETWRFPYSFPGWSGRSVLSRPLLVDSIVPASGWFFLAACHRRPIGGALLLPFHWYSGEEVRFTGCIVHGNERGDQTCWLSDAYGALCRLPVSNLALCREDRMEDVPLSSSGPNFPTFVQVTSTPSPISG